MEILCKIVHVVAALFLVLVVLLQSGRGGGMGAAFGGASSQIFGGRGANNFLTRVTTGAAIVFFITSFSLSYFSSQQNSVMLRGGRAMNVQHTAATDVDETDAEATKTAESAGADTGSIKTDSEPKTEGKAVRDPDAPAATPPGVPSGEQP